MTSWMHCFVNIHSWERVAMQVATWVPIQNVFISCKYHITKFYKCHFIFIIDLDFIFSQEVLLDSLKTKMKQERRRLTSDAEINNMRIKYARPGSGRKRKLETPASEEILTRAVRTVVVRMSLDDIRLSVVKQQINWRYQLAIWCYNIFYAKMLLQRKINLVA